MDELFEALYEWCKIILFILSCFLIQSYCVGFLWNFVLCDAFGMEPWTLIQAMAFVIFIKLAAGGVGVRIKDGEEDD